MSCIDLTFCTNQGAISLLPIFGTMMKDCNSFFNYFLIVLSNRHFTPSQSGFLPGDLCIVQIISIIHEIQTALDKNPTADVRGIFLDISKAFHKVWHDGVEGELLLLFKNYLENREQSCFGWSNI